MNYTEHYRKLIERGTHRRHLAGYVEKHHILPRCLGGADTEENLVILTAEEHFVAHQLLVKMWPDNRKILSALTKMCSTSKKNIRNNKVYGWIRKRWSESFSGENHPLSRITNCQAIEIYKSAEDPDILADRYCIDRYSIFAIKRKLKYSSATNNITELPGIFFGGTKKIRIPIPVDLIPEIFYDTGTYEYFWNKYRATRSVVIGIKKKKSFKRITSVLGDPGQIKRYNLSNDDIQNIILSPKSCVDLETEYSVHRETIRNIKQGHTRSEMWEEF